jgi:hypothetical protein
LLVGLFCIQCISGGVDTGSRIAIGGNQDGDPKAVAGKVVELAKTDHIALLKYCLDHYNRTYRDYTCTLVKQERINGVLGAEQEVQVKYKELPFSVAMKWTRNPPLGDRLLYVEGKFDNNMMVRPANNLLRVLTGGQVLRKPDGPEAMRSTLRPVNLFGFRRGMEELIKVYCDARDAGHLKEAFGGFAEVAGRKTLVLERYLPAAGNYPAWKTVICIDLEFLVPVCIEGHDWDKQLSSRYVFENVRFNTGLTDDDFLPEANDMKSTPAKK